MIAYRVYNHVPHEGEFNMKFYLSRRQAEAEVDRRKREDVDVQLGWETPMFEKIEIIEEEF